MPSPQDFLKLKQSFDRQIAKAEIKQMPAWETHNRPVVLVHQSNLQQAIEEVRTQSILGFDTESRPTFKRGSQDNPISLIQLASPEKCWLFQMNKIDDLTSVAKILQSTEIRKVGLGLSSDRRRFKQDFSVQIRNLLDLDVIFRGLGRKNQMGAKQMVAQLFGKNLRKSKKQSLSNWANEELTRAQISYASDDAFCVIDAWYELHKMLSPYREFMPERLHFITTPQKD